MLRSPTTYLGRADFGNASRREALDVGEIGENVPRLGCDGRGSEGESPPGTGGSGIVGHRRT